jgi:hypothetical protein
MTNVTQIKKGSSVDVLFLAFLILFTQGVLPLKIIGIVLIYLLRPINIFKRRIKKIEIFYLLFLAFSLLSSLQTLFIREWNYLILVLIGSALWGLSIISLKQILFFIDKQSTRKIFGTLDAFFYINTGLCVFQLFVLMYNDMTWNPYIFGSYGMGSGDFIKGIFANSSVNMIVYSFFTILYFTRGKIKKGVIAIIFMVMTTYMSGIVIFFASVGVLILFSSKVNIRYKVTAILGGMVLIVLFTFVSPKNADYVVNNITMVFKKHKPRKIISLLQTWEYWTDDVDNFLFGSGVANFSSRVAFIGGGDYVGWFPKDLVYRSVEFDENHFKLWNKEILSKPYQDGTANQPFSIYNQVVGEYGLVGLIAFLSIYIGYFFKRYKKLSYGRLILASSLGFFFLDYWYEYFSVIIFFELFLLIDLKLNEKGMYRSIF